METSTLFARTDLIGESAGMGKSPEEQVRQAVSSRFSSQHDNLPERNTRTLIEGFNQELQSSQSQVQQLADAETAELPDDVHFLNRLSYGPTPMSRMQVEQLGWQVMLEEQLDSENIDTSQLDAALLENFPTLAMTPREIVDAYEPGLISQLIGELIISTLLRQAYSPAQLYERMVEFWSDHFNMNILDAPVFIFKTSDDRDAIRPNALGKFRDLLHANARSPAMLLYLDNYSNTKDGPNENYARELLELHTLGVNGGYTEADVVEVARAFTGWTIHPRTLDFVFYFPNHDRRKKNVLGQQIKHTYNGGVTDGEQVLDLLASHPSTARFVSTKLARRFVSDDPPTELIDEMSQVFLDTDGEIKELLRTLFNSDAFWASQEQKMKRPLDFLTSMIRRLGFDPGTDIFRYFFSRLEQMSQVPFFWHAPNGYPDIAAYWANTAAMISRWNSGKDFSLHIPEENLESLLEGADTPNQIIQAMAVGLIDRKLSTDERRALRRNIFAGHLPNQPLEGKPTDYARIVAIVLLGSRYFQAR